MFGIPERHIDQIVESGEIPDPISSLIEECGELITVLAKHSANRYESWDESREHICEEISHVLISMNLVARALNMGYSDFQREVMIKAIKADFDTSDYIFR